MVVEGPFGLVGLDRVLGGPGRALGRLAHVLRRALGRQKVLSVATTVVLF